MLIVFSFYLDYLNAVGQSSQYNPTEIYTLPLENSSAEVNIFDSIHDLSDQQQLGKVFNIMKIFRLLFHGLSNNSH